MNIYYSVQIAESIIQKAAPNKTVSVLCLASAVVMVDAEKKNMKEMTWLQFTLKLNISEAISHLFLGCAK